MPRTLALVSLLLAACSSSMPMGSTSVGGGPAGSGSGETGNSVGTGTAAGTGSGGLGSASGNGSTGSSSGATGGNGSGPTIETFVKSYSTALCDYNFVCQADADYYLALCNSYSAPGYNDLPLAVDAGRVGYSAALGQMCIDSFTNATCYGTPPPSQTACHETLRGLVVPGQPCYSTTDCSGSFCMSSNGCAGTCTLYAETGDACSAALPCNPSEGLGCLNSKCVAPRDYGAQCGVSDPPCDVTAGLACIAGACLHPPQELMKPCVYGHGQCDTGSYCFQKNGVSSGKCLAALGPNGICGEDADHLKNAFSSTDFECADGFQVTQCVGAGTLLDGGVRPGVCTLTAGEQNGCPDVPAGLDLTKPFGSGCKFGLDCAGPLGFATCDRTNVPPRGCYGLPYPCDPTKAFCNYAVDGGVAERGDGPDDAGVCTTAYRTGEACTGPDQCGVFNICNDAGVCGLPTGPVCSPAF
jgi:hypothetical protein